MAPKKHRHLDVAPVAVGDGTAPTELDIESPVPVMAQSPLPGQIPVSESDVEGILRDPNLGAESQFTKQMVQIKDRLLMPAGLFTFGEALMHVVNAGARVRRESWPNDGTYLTMNLFTLAIAKPGGTLAPFHVDAADIVAQDWIVLTFPA